MSNNKNLIPINKRTTEEQRKIAQKGGIASGKVRREKRKFKKILNDSKDKNKIFTNNAEYFYYIEKQYNINGVFVAAVGIHESAWGTSKIALQKNNLFGYGAYNFSNYSESIDLISRVFVKYYINPKGTSIYGGEKAVGTYYNGSNLSGINKKYASDSNWANAVYSHMQYLYNKL